MIVHMKVGSERIKCILFVLMNLGETPRRRRGEA